MPNSNIHRTFECPVCGYDKLDDPPYEDGLATFTICPCCGTEFGYDDSTMKHSTLRQRWIDNGMLWWSHANTPPTGWDPVKQLENVHIHFAHSK